MPAARPIFPGMATRALALDLGSSSVRALVFEAAGQAELSAVPGALARRPRHLTSSEPGQATFDADSYVADLVACLDELHAGGFLEGVTEVALDSQWHSVLAVDPQGRPATDVVSWADTRSQRPRPSCTPEALEVLRQRTGCAFSPMYWTWRVPWLRGQLRAGVPNAAARFLGLSEYVGLELLADPSMSVSMASATGLLSTRERFWDAEALALAGVSAAELPELAPPGWEGKLTEKWRERWPELAAARWHPALGDGAAANLGVGCDVPGRAAMTIGTSAAVRSVTIDEGRDLSPLPPGLWRYCVDHRRTITGAAYSSGGQLYAWALALWEGSRDAAWTRPRHRTYDRHRSHDGHRSNDGTGAATGAAGPARPLLGTTSPSPSRPGVTASWSCPGMPGHGLRRHLSWPARAPWLASPLGTMGPTSCLPPWKRFASSWPGGWRTSKPPPTSRWRWS